VPSGQLLPGWLHGADTSALFVRIAQDHDHIGVDSKIGVLFDLGIGKLGSEDKSLGVESWHIPNACSREKRRVIVRRQHAVTQSTEPSRHLIRQAIDTN
jgi:hypothetical protein